jgi:hypothetical protein
MALQNPPDREIAAAEESQRLEQLAGVERGGQNADTAEMIDVFGRERGRRV